MAHYDLADWMDHVRGLGPADVRAAMEAHLLGGCDRCGSARTSVEQMTVELAADEACEPPKVVVRQAHAIFAQFQPQHVCGLPRLLASLVQDVMGQPLPSGLRGFGRTTRRALYRAGDSVVDLRVEHLPGQEAVVLVGQCLPGADSNLPMRPRPVVLTAGRRVVMTTATNAHGEFHLEYRPAGHMELQIATDDGQRRVQILLAPLHGGGEL